MPAESTYQEKELFRLIADGNEEAFRKLFHLYTPLIRSIALRVTQAEAAIPDLVQEVFLRVWLSRDKLPEIEQPRVWILQIVYHQCFNWLRQQRVRLSAADRMRAAAEEYSPTPEDAASFGETSRMIREAIAQLSPQCHKVYLLSREEGMKIPAIAERLGLSVQTVKNTLSRALKDIRTWLEERGVYLPVVLLAWWLWEK